MFSSNLSALAILITILSIFVINPILCQRSPYAGSRPSGYADKYKPQDSGSTTEEILVNRFGDDNSATQRPPVAGVIVVQSQPVSQVSPTTNQNRPQNNNNNNNNNINDLNNRIDLNGNVQPANPTRIPQTTTAPTGSTTTTRLPFDAYNDQYLVDNANRNSVDQRPFWLINAEHIERLRNQTSNQVGNFNPAAQPSVFQG